MLCNSGEVGLQIPPSTLGSSCPALEPQKACFPRADVEAVRYGRHTNVDNITNNGILNVRVFLHRFTTSSPCRLLSTVQRTDDGAYDCKTDGTRCFLFLLSVPFLYFNLRVLLELLLN